MEYSSQIVKDLLTNNTWSFWKKDWSHRIIVDWDPAKVKLAEFKKQIRLHVGKGFLYERSLSNEPTQFIATKTGLETK